MLDKIVDKLGEDIASTKIYGKVICFAEMTIDGEGKKQPKAYDTDGQLKNVSDFDNENGLCYFRKTAKVRASRISADRMLTACEEAIDVIFPLRFVGMVNKNKFEKDDSFTDDRIAIQILNVLQSRHATINSALNARDVSITVKDYETDSIRILADEYVKIERKDFDYAKSYIAIDFDVVVTMTVECFEACIN